MLLHLKDDVLGFIGMANDVLLILYGGLVSSEEVIDELLPTKDYLVGEKHDLAGTSRDSHQTALKPNQPKNQRNHE